MRPATAAGRLPGRATTPPTVPERIRREILRWFDREKRALPWRGTRDPYRIWVSEIMLAQTTVAAVRRRYDTFLARFPTLSALARAREESVLAAWSGLGYYARARNLRRAAREILRRHGGVFPSDPLVLRRLPGFGDYTAAAVASLAFGVRAPAADANVTRVVSRLFALTGVAGTRRNREAVLARLRELLPEDRPGDVTAAIMDLGQSLCASRRPDCPRCPLETLCEARRLGRPESFPRRPARPRGVRVALAAAVAERGGRVLLLRRKEGFLRGLWQFPASPASGADARAARRALTRTLAGLGLSRERAPVAAVRHTVVHRRLEVEVFRAGVPSRLAVPADGRWFSSAALSRAAIPTLTRKIARAAGFLPA